jgi:hypothetical protein
MLKEKELEPAVEAYLKSHFCCFETGIRKGIRILGTIDAFGIRDVGGRFSGDVELVIVEIKRSINNFGKIIGQAFGYSVCGHKCYLACYFKDKTGFMEEHKQVATHLGVGLIEIRKRKNNFYCNEVLSSSHFTPKNYFMLNLLSKVEVYKCMLCGVFFQYYDEKNDKNNIWRHEYKINRPLLYTERKHKRLFVCDSCSRSFDFEGQNSSNLASLIGMIIGRLGKRNLLPPRYVKRGGKKLDEFYLYPLSDEDRKKYE